MRAERLQVGLNLEFARLRRSLTIPAALALGARVATGASQ